MARLIGVDLPREKRLEIALTYIFGIGRTRAAETLAATGLSGDIRVHQLTDEQLVALRDHIEANYETEGDLRRSVDTELAAARMTGRLLAVLPLVGIGLGYAVGGDPVAYLTASTPGLMCLASGTAAAVAGVV